MLLCPKFTQLCSKCGHCRSYRQELLDDFRALGERPFEQTLPTLYLAWKTSSYVYLICFPFFCQFPCLRSTQWTCSFDISPPEIITQMTYSKPQNSFLLLNSFHPLASPCHRRVAHAERICPIQVLYLL